MTCFDSLAVAILQYLMLHTILTVAYTDILLNVAITAWTVVQAVVKATT